MKEEYTSEIIEEIGSCLREIKANITTIKTATESIQHTHNELREHYYHLKNREGKEERQIYIPTRISGKGGRLDTINKEDLKVCPACGERSLVSYEGERMFCFKCHEGWERIKNE